MSGPDLRRARSGAVAAVREILAAGVVGLCGVLAAGVAGTRGSPAAGASAPAPAVTTPLVAAHRGGSLLWPENTLRAFRGALTLPVDFLETDLHRTRDGEIVLLHDPTVDRMTTGHGAIRDLSSGEIAALRIRGSDGTVTTEGIPRLGDLLDLAAPTRVQLLLEIKVGADQRRYPGIEEAALGLVRVRGLLSRVTVMSFDRATVRRVRELDASVRTGLLVGRGQRGPADGEGAVAWAREDGATDLGLDHRLIEARVVQAAHRAGLRLAGWTVNEEADIHRMIDLGVDVVISDRPDLPARLAGR